MDEPVWLILTIIRLVVPLLILRWPLFGILASMVVDFIDFNLLPLQTDEDHYLYQIWDKVLDTYYLSFAAYVAFFWKDTKARILALSAFAHRTVGVLLFIAVEDQFLLLLFPNFFENFFIFYLLFRKFKKRQDLFTSRLTFAIVFVSLLIPKATQEFYLHVGMNQDSIFMNIKSLPKITVYIPPDVLGAVLYVLVPALVLVWRLRSEPAR